MGKPAGITRPAGLSRQTAARVTDDEEEEEVGLQPVHLGMSSVALLIALFFCWQTYSADQVPNRTSDYFFGTPKVGSSSAPSASSDDSGASDEEESDSDSSSDDSSEDSSDEEGDSDEEE